MSAAEAAAMIRSGDRVGMSGFTGSGYPKADPIELAHRIREAHFRGQKFQVCVIAMNGMIEVDIYGNVTSTHDMRSRIQNGIGGSGDFARNGYLSIFMAPSSAKKCTISTIVPMVSHVDHTDHDVQAIVTEQGLADLRRAFTATSGAPYHREVRQPPSTRTLLFDYLSRAEQLRYGKHTPHLLTESLGWHHRYLRSGRMKPGEVELNLFANPSRNLLTCPRGERHRLKICSSLCQIQPE